MRAILSVLVIIYLVGIGVALAPTIRDRWSAASASEFTQDVIRELPYAVRWPVRAFRSIGAGGETEEITSPAPPR